MQVDRTRRLEHAPQLDDPRGHHREVRKHVGFAEEPLHRDERVRHSPALLDGLRERARRALVPLPSVLERLDLSRRPRAVLLGEEDVVVLVALERRVQVDEVHRLVLHVPP